MTEIPLPERIQYPSLEAGSGSVWCHSYLNQIRPMNAEEPFPGFLLAQGPRFLA
jgi:hypothetical protein